MMKIEINLIKNLLDIYYILEKCHLKLLNNNNFFHEYY